MDPIHLAVVLLASICDFLVVGLDFLLEVLRPPGPLDVIHLGFAFAASGCDVLLNLLYLLLEITRTPPISNYEVESLFSLSNDLQETFNLKFVIVPNLSHERYPWKTRTDIYNNPIGELADGRISSRHERQAQ